MFLGLGWSQPQGTAALTLVTLMLGELVITLWDFVEEDRTRRLPATERVNHTLLTLNYGIILALLLPVLWDWAALPTALTPAYYGAWSWLCAVAAVGVVCSGLRDLAVARRLPRLVPQPAASLAETLTRPHAILVTGGTGFVGRRLVAALAEAGHEVTVLTRALKGAPSLPLPIRLITSLDQIEAGTRFDAIVNLAGEPISDGLWTASKRWRILQSRLLVTRDVVQLIGRLAVSPSVLVSGSAVGWYGIRGDEALDERAAGQDCFSRRICLAWERAAGKAAIRGVRVVALRIGLVLGSDGGLLSRLLTPFELGLGGRFGSGRHWMSWIHRDDVVRLILHAIATPTLEGPVNATAPEPVTNARFTGILGQALRRPTFFTVPARPLRWLLGAFADELLLGDSACCRRRHPPAGFASHTRPCRAH